MYNNADATSNRVRPGACAEDQKCLITGSLKIRITNVAVADYWSRDALRIGSWIITMWNRFYWWWRLERGQNVRTSLTVVLTTTGTDLCGTFL
jgi:hypothetical protein